jgi:HK97 family phage major capsid protein
MAAVPGISKPGSPKAFPADFQAQILSIVVGGAPFSRSCTPLPTARSSVAFGILDTNDPAWVAELDLIPDLAKNQTTYEVAVSKLAGSILISQESIQDSSFPLTASVSQAIADTFSHKLDADLIGAAGPAPVPTGILSVAAASDGTDLYGAAVKAKADIGGSGGAATNIALSPHFVGEVEALKDTTGAPLFPDVGTTFAGLATTVTVAATQPFVYDASRCWLVVRQDFLAESSNQTDSAWSHYATSLRIIGRFALAVPQPSRRCASSPSRAWRRPARRRARSNELPRRRVAKGGGGGGTIRWCSGRGNSSCRAETRPCTARHGDATPSAS